MMFDVTMDNCRAFILVFFVTYNAATDTDQGERDATVDGLPYNCDYGFVYTSVNCVKAFPNFGRSPVNVTGVLQRAWIRDCQFTGIRKNDLEGLSKLYYLEVACDYVGSSGQLSIESGAFDQTTDLMDVIIRDGGFRSITSGAFCKLTELGMLILERNDIGDVADIGLPHGCHLQVPSDCAPGVRMLMLAHNSIRVLHRDSRLCRLPRLALLDVSNNGLEVIEPGAFADLPSLMTLKLNDNRLKRLWPGTFVGLFKLWYLHLSNNLIKKEMDDVDTFAHLEELKMLWLDGNRLSDVEDMFSSLGNTVYLNLTANHIERLTSKTFSGMDALFNVILDKNHIDFIETDTFGSGVLFLQLSDNRLTDIRFVATAKGLTSLHLSDNLIELPDASVALCESCWDLMEIYLDGNSIANVGDEMFANLTKLDILDLSRNVITHIGNDSFRDLSKLTKLRLDSNRLGEPVDNLVLPTLFSLTRLESLNLSDNGIRSFQQTYSTMPANLLILYLDHNLITVFTAFRFSNLRHIDLSFNRLLMFFPDDKMPKSVQVLLANDNRIGYIQQNFLHSLRNLRKMYLHNNQLTTLRTLFMEDYDKMRPARTITLRGNPLRCDCQLKWLLDVVHNGGQYRDKEVLLVSDAGRLTCTRAFQRGVTNGTTVVSFVKAGEDDEGFLCPFERYRCAETLMRPAMCPERCPPECSCYNSASWTVIVVDCSYRRLYRMPTLALNQTTVLYLDGNDITRIGSNDFAAMPLIDTLDVSGNRLDLIELGAFNGLHRLRRLILSQNRLLTLADDLFERNVDMRILDLAHNLIANLDESVLAPLRHLRSLDLSDNQLTEYPVWTFATDLPDLDRLAIHSNPWSCKCEYAMSFADWLSNQSRIDIATRDIQCVDEDQGGDDDDGHPRRISMLAFNASHCYNATLVSVFKINEQKFFTALVMTLCLFLSTTVVSVLAFVYRREMEVLVYYHYGVRLFHGHDKNEGDGDGKTYDAFVSYNSLDSEFLVREFLPGLEDIEVPYVLCLHHRNFLVGAVITESISEAVDKSRRTVLLLTENFVRSEYCRYEFKQAHLQMMKDRRNRVIVVICGQIPHDELDKEMKLYLKTNTYLTWGERLFWQKLYFALPEKKPI